jgi:hypothetical protein
MLRIKFPEFQGVRPTVIVGSRRKWRRRPEASSPLWSAAFYGRIVVAVSLTLRKSGPLAFRRETKPFVAADN